jgi:hypothetical protein
VQDEPVHHNVPVHAEQLHGDDTPMRDEPADDDAPVHAEPTYDDAPALNEQRHDDAPMPDEEQHIDAPVHAELAHDAEPGVPRHLVDISHYCDVTERTAFNMVQGTERQVALVDRFWIGVACVPPAWLSMGYVSARQGRLLTVC